MSHLDKKKKEIMQNKQIEKLGLHNAFDSLAAPTQCTWRNINLILNIRREGMGGSEVIKGGPC